MARSTLNRRSAIKMLRPELATCEQVVTRFLNAAKAVNLSDHQNIVNVYDYGDSPDGSVYFVMAFLEGETLDDLMHKRRPMAMPLLLHVFGQIARALAAAHGKQIVHRDLKPANVFVVTREDNPYFIKLLDFGIAQLRGAGSCRGWILPSLHAESARWLAQVAEPTPLRCERPSGHITLGSISSTPTEASGSEEICA